MLEQKAVFDVGQLCQLHLDLSLVGTSHFTVPEQIPIERLALLSNLL
jgi:hypothetical protein